MKKKLLTLMALAAVTVGVVGLAAGEAHIINVTATIENALTVDTAPLTFGTVFPQESLDKTINMSLSESFLAASNTEADTVNYMIRQKPKCYNEEEKKYGLVTEDANGVYSCADGAGYQILPMLCPFLSKHEITRDGQNAGALLENDSAGIGAFHGPLTQWTLADTINTQVVGVLSKPNDTNDTWNIDLRVPCFKGMCAQDWADYVHSNNPNADPALYMLDPNDEHKQFGCDLWIETSEFGSGTNPTPTPGTTISSVNIGDTGSEANYTMLGWGNTVWPGSGGGWGGGDDGTIRTVSALAANDMYKAAYTSADSATIVMNFGAASATKTLKIRHLDGTANDSFNVLVDGVSVGNYADSTSTETWKTDSFSVNAYNGSHTVEIQLTGAHWASYNTYGQLGISFIEIVN